MTRLLLIEFAFNYITQEKISYSITATKHTQTSI